MESRAVECHSHSSRFKVHERAFRNDRRVWAVVAVLLSVHTGLLAYGARVHSPTLNEPGHLVAGISHWQFGRFELFPVNPPLVRMVAALPVMAAGCETDWTKFNTSPGSRPEGVIGADFIAANGERSLWLFTLARWACIPFSVIGGLFCFLWTRALFGHPGAGFVALTLWCFDPNIIAHGQLITPDCAAAALGLGAGYSFWRWLRKGTWDRALVAALMLGLAELAKTTWIILFVLWPMLWLFWCITARTTSARHYLKGSAQLAVILALALYLLNLGYTFQDSFTRLKDFTFISKSLTGLEKSGTPGNRFIGSWLGELPMPVPKQYLLGIDTQRRDFEDFHSPSYLRGEWKEGGWWYYYLYALWVKTPHGTQLLLVLVLASLFLLRSPETERRDLAVVLAPALLVLALVSAETEINHHFRYLLPAFGFGFVFLGRAYDLLTAARMPVRAATAAALSGAIVSSLWVYPHSLSYFNEFAGGPKNGAAHLLHSNIDWGQDLVYLKEWLEDHPEAQPFQLAYYGSFDPKDVGIDSQSPPLRSPTNDNNAELPPVEPGWYAVSVNYLRGDHWKVPRNAFTYFRLLRAEATAGYSIYIYCVTAQDAQFLSRAANEEHDLAH